MKKSILWMMAAILTCGFATTSCTDGVNGVDNPVVPIPEPAQPDQASMFVENIKADGRYTPAKLAVGGRDVDILRLDVADFEAAKAEFLKLLPEGVETTAFERTKFSEMFVEATYYLLNAPQENRKDSITFYKVLPAMNGLVGYAWIEMPSDIKKALNVTNVIYMQAASNDDMDAIAKAILTITPFSKPDTQDPTNLVCTVPNQEKYTELITPFLTTKMMGTATPTADGNTEFTLTDNDGKSYGKLTVLGKDNKPADVINMLILDEDLQKSLASKLGGAFSKITFCLAKSEGQIKSDDELKALIAGNWVILKDKKITTYITFEDNGNYNVDVPNATEDELLRQEEGTYEIKGGILIRTNKNGEVSSLAIIKNIEKEKTLNLEYVDEKGTPTGVVETYTNLYETL